MRRYFFWSLLLLGLFAGPLFVASQTAPPSAAHSREVEELSRQIEEKRARVKQLEESIEEYRKRIQQKHVEAVSLTNQMAILDARAEKVALDIEATETKLDTVALEIQSLAITIGDTEETIERQRRMVGEFLRLIRSQSGQNFIEILASHDSFSDFYNHLQYLERIDRDLGKSVRDLRATKALLERKNAEAKERRAAYDALKDQLTQKRRDLEGDLFAKQDLLAKTHASEATYQTLLASLKKQYQAVEDEIRSIEGQVRRKLEAQKKMPELPAGEAVFSWPTQSRYITAYFYDPTYPFRNIFEHGAVDIRAGQGTPIRAAAAGYVGQAKRCSTSACYSYVMIVHTGSLSTVYGHLSQIAVSNEAFVNRGDVIGYSGGTPGTVGAGPFVTGPHLHFEVRRNGIPVNPLDYLMKE